MTIEIGFTDELINTQYAPLAVLLYSAREQNAIVKSLEHKWDADASMILSTGFQDQHR